MGKTSFWNSLGNTIETIIFIKYGLPLLIIIFAILFGVAMINKWNVANKTDLDNSILYTDLKKTIYNIASETLNKNEFDLELSENSNYNVELEYTIKNKNYSSEQYNKLFKQEITNVYNEIKDKELVNDTLFAKDEDLKDVEIYFSFHYEHGYNTSLGGEEMSYSLEDKWDSSYQKIMESNITTQEELDKIKSTVYNK